MVRKLSEPEMLEPIRLEDHFEVTEFPLDGGRTFWFVQALGDGKYRSPIPARNRERKGKAVKHEKRTVTSPSQKAIEKIKAHYLLDETGTRVLHARSFTFQGRLISRGSPAHVRTSYGIPVMEVKGQRVPVSEVISVLSESPEGWHGEPVPITSSEPPKPKPLITPRELEAKLKDWQKRKSADD